MNLDDFQKKADAIRDRAEQLMASARNDRDLSDQARLARIVNATVEARDQLAQLRTELFDGLASERRQLERKLWASPGGSSDPAGWRAALDRAAAVGDEGEAEALLGRAERSGDDLLAKALVLDSLSRWPRVSIDYRAAHPEMTETVDALARHPAPTDVHFRMGVDALTAVAMPPELTDVAGWNLDRMATQLAEPAPRP